MNDHRSTLWDFSVALYASPALEKICLHLQDEWQANVNVLLWCCWLELRQTPLTSGRLDRALEQLESWHQMVVEPLRQARRDIKQQCDVNDVDVSNCRQMVKAAELAAERVEQSWLETLAGSWNASPTDTTLGCNLRVYLEYLGVPEEVCRGAIDALLLATATETKAATKTRDP